MNNNKTYRAFISYSHADQKWGRWLHRSLENYRTPKLINLIEAGDEQRQSRLTPIFRDREELASSPDLSERINLALLNSESLIVICSPSSAKSHWVDEEISAFKRLGRSEQIFCLIVAGDPGAPGTENDCFPPSLRIKFDKEGNQVDGKVEPVAADARDKADGKKLALLKLIAGLQGVGLDDLRQRDLQRRNQRLAMIAVSSLVAAIITITLSISAVISRNEAVIARTEAEQRREQAESLINFMLGDLRERLEPVGRLDVLDGVGEQALAYFSSLTELELTTDALLTRATALRQIGEVRIAQGLITEGLAALHESLELLENSSTENEGVRLFELGQINYWIADAYFNDLSLEEAQTYIERYLEISRSLVLLEPNNSKYQLELLYAESNLGTLALRANDLIAARVYFNNALLAGRSLSSEIPDDEKNAELAITLSWLGAVEAAAGNYLSSLDWYQQQLDLRRDLLASNGTPNRKHIVGRALFLLGGIQVQVGQVATATTAFEESVQLYRELVAYDPQNYEWQEELAWSLTSLAACSYKIGRSTAETSRATLSLAREAISRVGQESTAETDRVLAAIDLELANIELIEGAPELALNLAQNSTGRLEKLVPGNDRMRVLSLYARAAYVASESALSLGDKSSSIALAKVALANINLRDSDPIEVKANAALLLFRAEDRDAEVLLEEVTKTEYRAQIFIPNTEAERWWNQRND